MKNKLNWFVCFYWNGNISLSTIHLQFIPFHISIYLKPLENYANNLVACNRVLCWMNNLFGDMNDWMRSVFRRVRIYRLVRFVWKKLNAENIVLFDLACRLLSFKMYFRCTELERYEQRERETETEPRISDIYCAISMWHDSLYVSVQLTKVGKYTMLYPFHSSAILNNPNKNK